MEEENVIGFINLKVTDTDVLYETEFSLEEVVFWLNIFKAMVIKRVLDNGGTDG